MGRLLLILVLLSLPLTTWVKAADNKPTNPFRKGDILTFTFPFYGLWANTYFTKNDFIWGLNFLALPTLPIHIGESFPIGIKVGTAWGLNTIERQKGFELALGDIYLKISWLNLEFGVFRPYLFLGNHFFVVGKTNKNTDIKETSFLGLNPAVGMGLSFFGEVAGLTLEVQGIYTSLGSNSPNIIPSISLGLSLYAVALEDEITKSYTNKQQIAASTPSPTPIPSPSPFPENPELHFKKALILLEQDNYEAAIKEFQEVLRINPNYPLIHTHLNNAKVKYKEWLYNKAMEHFGKANILYGKKNYEEAIAEYKEVLKIRPDDVDAHFAMAEAFFHVNSYSNAIEHYRRAVQLKPDRTDFQISLSNALVLLGVDYYSDIGDADENENRVPDKFEKAMAAFREAISINNNAHAYNELGNIYFSLKQYSDAIALYKEAIQINPRIAVYYKNLGYAYYYSEEYGYDEAINAYKEALRLTPKDADIFYYIGNCYYYSKRYEEAIKAYQQAIRLNPEHSDAHTYLQFARNELANLRPNMSVIGPKPSDYVWQIKQLLYRVLHDPYSAAYFDWTKPAPIKRKGEWYWTVTFRLRAKNRFGAFVCCDNYRLFIRQNRIVDYVLENQENEE